MITRTASGGQTGVDRAALDAALEQGFACGGWCPQGRRAEDGRIPDRYPLQENDSPRYPARTAQNIRDSDGTLIIFRGRPDRGTRLTFRLTEQGGKPCLAIDLGTSRDRDATVETILAWAEQHAICTLNVAGPGESHCPGIHGQALEILRELIARHRTADD